ncbi:hypothetical protein [Photorhabdus laumondii]|uniref:hypothetical protein n=1 Tax=Photorhabdus laumondii TaxID=2218628 RepID=UPI0033150F3C
MMHRSWLYTLWILRWIVMARECSQQRGNLKDNGYNYFVLYEKRGKGDNSQIYKFFN